MVYGHLWLKLSNERGTGRSKGEHSAWTLDFKGDADTPHTQLRLVWESDWENPTQHFSIFRFILGSTEEFRWSHFSLHHMNTI